VFADNTSNYCPPDASFEPFNRIVVKGNTRILKPLDVFVFDVEDGLATGFTTFTNCGSATVKISPDTASAGTLDNFMHDDGTTAISTVTTVLSGTAGVNGA
jgi:hypothetical protein